MSAPQKLAVTLFTALAVAACNAGGSSGLPLGTGQSTIGSQSSRRATPACAGSRIRHAQCDLLLLPSVEHDTPAGWTPANLEAAYNLPSSRKGSGQIVAIVDAYDNPNVASDLAEYRSYFGLSTANFTKYNQDGQQGNYPQGNQHWGLEIDLDVEMVSASCPNCTIYLIEANSDAWSDLQTAEAEAVTLGAHIISNSYTGSLADESYYDTPGVTYLASSGDYGYSLYDPATFGSVVSVGGTLLSQGGGKRGWTEVVWNVPPDGYATGGGCSSLDETRPSWQHNPGCKFRTGNDVSAVAWDVAEYDSYDYGGWFEVGGTSVASPLLAGVFALAGNATSQNGGEAFWTMSKQKRSKDLFEITSGNDGTCSPKYLCTGGTRQYGTYSGPAGWGTPNGIGAF
jgi:subtilase family serine protease